MVVTFERPDGHEQAQTCGFSSGEIGITSYDSYDITGWRFRIQNLSCLSIVWKLNHCGNLFEFCTWSHQRIDRSTEATCQKGYSIHPPSFGHWLQRSGRDSCDGTVEPCFDFFLGFARMKVSILMDSEEGNPRARWFLEDLGHENLWETLRTLWWLSESFDFHMLRTQALIPIGFLGQILTGPGPGPIYGYGLPMWKNCKHVQDLRKLHVMRDLVGFQC